MLFSMAVFGVYLGAGRSSKLAGTADIYRIAADSISENVWGIRLPCIYSMCVIHGGTGQMVVAIFDFDGGDIFTVDGDSVIETKCESTWKFKKTCTVDTVHCCSNDSDGNVFITKKLC